MVFNDVPVSLKEAHRKLEKAFLDLNEGESFVRQRALPGHLLVV